MSVAIYTRNRLLGKKNEVTPYEMWHGVRPDVSNLRVFGQKGFVHIPKEKRTKLEGKAQEMILVGYGDSNVIYHMMHPITKSIRAFSNVYLSTKDSNINNDRVLESVGDVLLLNDLEDFGQEYGDAGIERRENGVDNDFDILREPIQKENAILVSEDVCIRQGIDNSEREIENTDIVNEDETNNLADNNSRDY